MLIEMITNQLCPKTKKVLVYIRPILFNESESSKVRGRISQRMNKPRGKQARGEKNKRQKSQGAASLPYSNIIFSVQSCSIK